MFMAVIKAMMMKVMKMVISMLLMTVMVDATLGVKIFQFQVFGFGQYKNSCH